jgi:hypothetical protein
MQRDMNSFAIPASMVSWLRRDGGVIALYIVATIIMTYPVAFRLNGDWIALRDSDTYMKLWDQWYFGRAISSGQSLGVTHELFYPIGVDLAYHSISWTVSALNCLLTPIFSAIGAYNFSILFAVFTTAYCGYLLIRSMVNHRSAAWLGGAVYSFIPYHIAHAGGHPDLVHLATIPLAALLLIRAFSHSSMKAAAGAAIMLGLAAWTSLYILVFAFFTVFPIFIYLMLAQQRWRDAKYWRIAAVMSVVSAVTIGVRVLPIFQSPDALSTAIEQKYAADAQTDLISFVLPSQYNPILGPLASPITASSLVDYSSPPMSYKWPAYLGIIPILLCLSAIGWKKQRARIWAWLVLGMFFIILCLGSALRFNGPVYSNFTLPAAYLAWFPPIRAVRPDFFVLGASLPLAVCAALGFERWLTAWDNRPRAQMVLTISVCGLLLFEYWNGPFPGVSASVSPFYTQLANDAGQFDLIDLPMGRQESKAYLYFQTIHHRPIVEGLIGRTPPGAYNYIHNNALLSRWQVEAPLDCRQITYVEIERSLGQLASDGFRYIIVHHEENQTSEALRSYFTILPVYDDGAITVYSVADLQANPPCVNTP